MDPNQFSSALDVSQFMQGVQNATPPPMNNEDRLRLTKLYMNGRESQGKVAFIPYPGKEGFYLFFTKTEHEDNRVREIRTWNEEFEDFSWYKILPKSFYGALTPEQDALYNEVVSKFEHVDEEELLDRDDLRRRSYGLHYGYILSHTNTQNQTVKDTKLGPALIVAPSASCPASFNSGIGDMSSSAGNTDWIPAMFNAEKSGRKGYLLMGFTKATAGFGYDVKYTPGFSNPPMVNIPPADFLISDEEFSLFDSILKDFLGWQNGKDGALFSEECFEAIKFKLNLTIKGGNEAAGVNDATASAASVPQVPEVAYQAAPAQVPTHLDPMASIQAPPAQVPPIPQAPVAGLDPMLANIPPAQVPPIPQAPVMPNIPPVPQPGT